MKITVKLNQGQLSKEYGKFGNAADFKGAYPLRSFPISIYEQPAQTASFALTAHRSRFHSGSGFFLDSLDSC